MRGNQQPINSAWIKRRAMELGFSLVGITTPEPPAHLDVYRNWIKAGRHADMNYLARTDAITKREDPRLLLPNCQAIVVTGTFHNPRESELSTEFQVAMYALGKDYHQVLAERLRQLVNEVELQAGNPVQHRIYTDTGPLLERELAQRSGLGWIGKNTCLIHPKLGSNFLLAEILLDLPLEPDPPFIHDRCGSCTRCIDTCPTKCILPDRTIDAGHCISYLTIENKGTIPHDQRQGIGNWIFGCDVCQQVCPWNNRFAQPTSDPAFEPRPFLRQAKLSDFLKLPPQNWRRPFRESPLERPRRRGLVRNAAIVAGNLAREEWIDDLEHILRNDPDPQARAHAVWALKKIDHPRPIKILNDQLARDQDAHVRLELERE